MASLSSRKACRRWAEEISNYLWINYSRKIRGAGRAGTIIRHMFTT
jgi:S-methylmethionine-dependent homocysteine/selenocysteine methylase